MTLDEAIKHAEEVMVENLEKTKGRNASDPIAINCFECAEEHRQLAEWLKELKQLREPTSVVEELEKIRAEIKELAFLFDDLSPDKELVVDLDNIEEVFNNHITELKGENK